MTEPGERPTVAPFVAALGVVVLVVLVIGLVNLVGGGDELPADQQVARAAVAQNDALQRQSYSDVRAHTCLAEQTTETEVLDRQRDSVAERGERYVDDVTGVAIDGDRATATVTYHFDNAPDAKTDVEMTFVREDGAWKVCSPGPG